LKKSALDAWKAVDDLDRVEEIETEDLEGVEAEEAEDLDEEVLVVEMKAEADTEIDEGIEEIADAAEVSAVEEEGTNV
jgi:hypothetical protein